MKLTIETDLYSALDTDEMRMQIQREIHNAVVTALVHFKHSPHPVTAEHGDGTLHDDTGEIIGSWEVLTHPPNGWSESEWKERLATAYEPELLSSIGD
jgi:hypothetical protein